MVEVTAFALHLKSRAGPEPCGVHLGTESAWARDWQQAAMSALLATGLIEGIDEPDQAALRLLRAGVPSEAVFWLARALAGGLGAWPAGHPIHRLAPGCQAAHFSQN